MSRIIAVYDPKRNPREWNLMLTGSQVAAFTEDACDELPIRDSSDQPTCDVFEDFHTAELRCRQIGTDNSRLRCLVFDTIEDAGAIP